MTNSGNNAKTHPSQAFYDLAMADEETLDEVEGCQPSPEHPGMVIAGRYELKSVLGEGGTGQVWRAEQTTPVKREVAVKIIRPGLLSQPVSARFNREHQVLALMEHPGIAGVFDAGELPDGRTFFVMEVVHGSAITRWCKKTQPPLHERLEVFFQACMAVQHAHQKGVLHRDLKPSNVMVTLVDGKPVVKVIDFGIAKALEGDLATGQDVTLRGMVLGTPRYMSPEQAGLTGEEVDARAVVYALGVLLYELLTGTTPLVDDGADDSPLPVLLQRVRELEIEPPSRRAQRGVAKDAKPTAGELRGDLDWIALCALQKNREQRYATAQALADDVRRHLNHEPVLAGPPGAAYRLKKWLVRHHSTVKMTAAVLVSLAGGLAATSWALKREEAQRQVALIEADLARQVSAQLKELLGNARKHAEAGMNTQMLRNLADECAAGISRFANQPETELQLAHQLAQLYTALEEDTRALPWYRRRWELTKQTQGEHSIAALQALYTLGWKSIGQGDPQTAVELLRQTVKGYEALADTHQEKHQQTLLAQKELARALARAGQHPEAVELMAVVIKAKGESAPADAAIWLRDQADILKTSGRHDEASKVLRHALELLPKTNENVGLRTYLLTTLAGFERKAEPFEEALAASAERLALLEGKSTTGHPKLLNVLIEHATLACRVAGCPGGEEAARRALAMAQTAGHETRLADAWIALSETLRIKRQFRESEQSVRDAIVDLEKTKAEQWRVLELHRRLGDLLTARSQFEEALAEYETAAKGWFAETSTSRPRDKEELIFISFDHFWKQTAKAKSPLADAQRQAEWAAKHQAWKTSRKRAPQPQ
jgi:tetratricopeptide (TPR) repeat protein/tRNA A-37 threonylcarbamoyl transferase component Bud32